MYSGSGSCFFSLDCVSRFGPCILDPVFWDWFLYEQQASIGSFGLNWIFWNKKSKRKVAQLTSEFSLDPWIIFAVWLGMRVGSELWHQTSLCGVRYRRVLCTHFPRPPKATVFGMFAFFPSLLPHWHTKVKLYTQNFMHDERQIKNYLFAGFSFFQFMPKNLKNE